MYRCGICGEPSKPREPLIRAVVPKHDNPKQIAREIPVCRACAKQLQAGLTIADIARTLTPAEPEQVPVVARANLRATI